VKKGVMIVASFAEIPRQSNNREDNAQIRAGEGRLKVFSGHVR
jgi:hypothetical protein